MSKVYLPTAEQMDYTIEQLGKIASALGSEVDTSTWAGVQQAVKLGLAPQLFPIGSQLVVNHSRYGSLTFDVVAHDHYKSVEDENAHTLTLMLHTLSINGRYDAPEAFYYATQSLPAGYYNFTIPRTVGAWTAGTYYFGLADSLPANGQLCITGNFETPLTSLSVAVYSNPLTTTASYTTLISAGTTGTSLGTFGVELNNTYRVSYGSNNYKESAVRQFLNSSNSAGSVWMPQTMFDRPSSWAVGIDGFLYGMDEEFLSVVGEVVVPCTTNDVYESPVTQPSVSSTYTLSDKFYLPSADDIFGEGADKLGMFPYFDDATDADRVKYGGDGAPIYWWTRSCSKDSPSIVVDVRDNGTKHGHHPQYLFGVAAVCTIV